MGRGDWRWAVASVGIGAGVAAAPGRGPTPRIRTVFYDPDEGRAVCEANLGYQMDHRVSGVGEKIEKCRPSAIPLAGQVDPRNKKGGRLLFLKPFVRRTRWTKTWTVITDERRYAFQLFGKIGEVPRTADMGPIIVRFPLSARPRSAAGPRPPTAATWPARR